MSLGIFAAIFIGTITANAVCDIVRWLLGRWGE